MSHKAVVVGELIQGAGGSTSLSYIDYKMARSKNGVYCTVHHARNYGVVKGGFKKDIIGCTDITSVGAKGKLGVRGWIKVGLKGFEESHRCYWNMAEGA